jgi:replicative DNA helicase
METAEQKITRLAERAEPEQGVTLLEGMERAARTGAAMQCA